jgi:signal transduction histidine kinase
MEAGKHSLIIFNQTSLFSSYLTRSAQSSAESKGIQLKFSTESQLFMDDSLAFNILSQNLLTNAIKFTPNAGQINIHVDTDTEERNRLFLK